MDPHPPRRRNSNTFLIIIAIIGLVGIGLLYAGRSASADTGDVQDAFNEFYATTQAANEFSGDRFHDTQMIADTINQYLNLEEHVWNNVWVVDSCEEDAALALYFAIRSARGLLTPLLTTHVLLEGTLPTEQTLEFLYSQAEFDLNTFFEKMTKAEEECGLI